MSNSPTLIFPMFVLELSIFGALISNRPTLIFPMFELELSLFGHLLKQIFFFYFKMHNKGRRKLKG